MLQKSDVLHDTDPIATKKQEKVMDTSSPEIGEGKEKQMTVQKM